MYSTRPGATQRVFDLIQLLPWLLGSLALLFAALSILLHDQKWAGLHNVATTFLGSGAVLILGSIVSTWMINNLNKPGGLNDTLSGEQATQQFMNSAVATLGGQFNQVLIWFGATHAVIGIITLVAMHFTRPKKPPEQPEEDRSGPNEADDTTPANPAPNKTDTVHEPTNVTPPQPH